MVAVPRNQLSYVASKTSGAPAGSLFLVYGHETQKRWADFVHVRVTQRRRASRAEGLI